MEFRCKLTSIQLPRTLSSSEARVAFRLRTALGICITEERFFDLSSALDLHSLGLGSKPAAHDEASNDDEEIRNGRY
ncbi:hypothetical protein D3C87_1892960 [compost metagenome]